MRFSGFSVYNIFFNHFHEAIVVFPLLLWALMSTWPPSAAACFCFVGFCQLFYELLFLRGTGCILCDLLFSCGLS